MADPQPITYTPQFQAPIWQDNVDLVTAGGPNGFNAQFKSLQAEFNVINGIVQQVNTVINTFIQTLNNIEATVTSASTTAYTANTTANAAITAARTAIAAANAAIATAKKAIQAVNNLPPLASLTVTVHHSGAYVAHCKVTYVDLAGQSQSQETGNFLAGTSWTAIVPGGSKSIHLSCEEYTGLAWNPVNKFVDQDLTSPLPQPITTTIGLAGSKISPTCNIT